MTVPTPALYLLLNRAAAGEPGYFTIGTSTIEGPDLIAGDTPIDVLGDADGMTFRVGRTEMTEPFEAVEGQVQLKNFDRRWDPNDPIAAYPGQARPNRRLHIEAGDVRLFTGYCENWDYQFEDDGADIVVIDLSDELVKLAGMTIPAMSVPRESTAARVSRVLDRINYPTGTRMIDPGRTWLPAAVIEDGTNALAYLKDVARAEQGGLFVDRETGRLRFAQRHAMIHRTVRFEVSDIPGEGVPKDTLTARWGNEGLFTRVVCSVEGGPLWTAELRFNVREKIGESTLRIEDLMGDPEGSDPLMLARYWLSRYGTPTWQIPSLRIDIATIRDEDTQLAVLEVELQDWLTITFLPARGVGDPIELTVAVQSITHEITPGEHTIEFALEPADTRSFFTIGESLVEGADLLAP